MTSIRADGPSLSRDGALLSNERRVVYSILIFAASITFFHRSVSEAM